MYHEFRHVLPGARLSTPCKGDHMKRWILVALFVILLSGCSWDKVIKWIDEMDWERDDQTVHITDILVK